MSIILITLISSAIALSRKGGKHMNPDRQAALKPFYAAHPVEAGSLVLVGDDLIADGLWNEIYNPGETKLYNRGIPGDGISDVAARAQKIASAHPAKIVICAGANDFDRATQLIIAKQQRHQKRTRRSNNRSTGYPLPNEIRQAMGEEPLLPLSAFDPTVKRVVSQTEKLFRSLHRISPKTELYWLSIYPHNYMNSSAVAAASRANAKIVEYGRESGLFKILDLEGQLNEGLTTGAYSYTSGRWLNDAGYARVAGMLSHLLGLKTDMSREPARFSEAQFESIRHWDGTFNPNGRAAEYYYDRLSQFLSFPRGRGGVVLFGDSLIDFGPWDELLPEYPVHLRGIAGDQLMGYTARVEEVASQNPSAVVLIGGCNNLVKNPDLLPEEIWPDYEALLTALRAAMPEVPLFVESILPLSPKDAGEYEGFNGRAAALNERLAASAEKYNYSYLDLAALLRDEKGDLAKKFTTDGCHLTAAAYMVWADQLREALGEEFKRK